MALTFHWISGSPFAWRVMLALEYKGLEYESARKDPAKKEHKTEAYLQINPRGKVPALQDGDFSMYESLGMLTYLENLQPEPALLGSSAQQTARIWQRILELDNHLTPAIMGIVRPVLFGSETPDLEKMAESIAATHLELKSIEERLENADYLAGDSLSAADIAFVPMLEYLVRACTKQDINEDNFGFLPLQKSYPNIAAWQKRIESMSGYDAAYPPHWR